MSDANQKVRRTVTGKVVSDKGDKSIVVEIERRIKHPIYGKYIRRSTRLMAHDADNQCRQGDLVIIEECRPISARKNWVLKTVLEQAPTV